MSRNLVTVIAYLSGVSKEVLDTKFNNSSLDLVSRNDDCVSIRELTILRNTIINSYKFKSVIVSFKSEYKLPYTSKSECVLVINQILREKFSSLKNLFPSYVNFSLLEEFICFNRNETLSDVQKAINNYMKNRNKYVHELFLNYNYNKVVNYLFLNDKYFMNILSLDREIPNNTKISALEYFTNNTNKLLILVDCENTDVYKFYGFLRSLNQQTINKIKRVLLINDHDNQNKVWDIIKRFFDMDIQSIQVSRILKNKSRVDLTLTIETCKARYRDNIKDIIIVSSDSDYSTLYEQLPSINFFVLYDINKWSKKSSEVLDKYLIKSEDINKFVPKSIEDLRDMSITLTLEKLLKEKMTLSRKEILDALKDDCRLMENSEINTIIDKKLSKLNVVVDSEGIHLKFE